MQIVIDIPNTIYQRYLKDDWDLGDADVVRNRIKNGTPLPKGHGNIVDIETMIDMFWDGNSMEITKYDLSVIEQIIEADKGESEGKE